MTYFRYGVDELTVNKTVAMAQGKLIGIIDEDAGLKVRRCRECVEAISQSSQAIYGINTGFGPLCETRISIADISKLQHNLLLSHAVGVGSLVDKSLSKIMMICKIHALCKGFSGIRLEVIERILYFVENDILPTVPEQGSLGASGDLAPLAHLFLPLIGEGEFWVGDEIIPAQDVLHQHQLKPIKLASKESLALINGTQFILAHTIMGLKKMSYLLDLSDVVGAMSLEGFQGSTSPFNKLLHEVRPFKGCQEVAERMLMLLENSKNLSSHKDCNRVQDPYSIRCIPQVHGASRNAFSHLLELVTIEMNSVTDNPVIFSRDEFISGGNFHGQPLAIAIDYATIAVAELGNISDRRCYTLIEGKYGLPRLLTKNEGINCGLMIPQYTTAALVSENKSFCFPASADSIPSSLGQEDHVSMGSISARKFNKVLHNLEKILAIEILYATQAMEYRRPQTFSSILEKNFSLVRKHVAPLEEDRLLKHDINTLIGLVQQETLIVR